MPVAPVRSWDVVWCLPDCLKLMAAGIEGTVAAKSRSPVLSYPPHKHVVMEDDYGLKHIFQVVHGCLGKGYG